MNKISIIIPVYNVEKYIGKCMASLQGQTFQNLEILLIDDGSTDGSGVLCDRYAEEDSRVRVFHQENGGVSRARNLGLEQATGDYVAFVDPDDWIEPESMECIVQDFIENDADAVFYGYDEVTDDLSLTKYPIAHSPEKRGLGDDRDAMYQMMVGIGKGYYTIIANKAFRRSVIESGAFRFSSKLAVGEDSVWLVDVCKQCKTVCFDNRIFYHWLQRADSASNSHRIDDRRLTAIDAQLENCQKLKDYGQDMVNLALAKLFNDCFFLQIVAYKEENRPVEQRIRQQIRVGKRNFYKSSEVSKVRKIKVLLCGLMMNLHVNGRWIDSLMNVTTYEIKQKLKGRK